MHSMHNIVNMDTGMTFMGHNVLLAFELTEKREAIYKADCEYFIAAFQQFMAQHPALVIVSCPLTTPHTK